MQLIDTHTHPHMEGYGMEPDEFFDLTRAADVRDLICVGTSAQDSRRAVELAREYGVYASAGLHPHEASLLTTDLPGLQELLPDKTVVAIGECGLDYYYEHSTREEQAEALHAQINLAKQAGLPLIFHVRDAFEDFFEIFDSYQNVSGVVHSFTADAATMQQCVERGLYLGLNGIVTFSKDEGLREAVQRLPLSHLLLETDAPFLTPHPYRGKLNHSAHVRTVAEFIRNLRAESLTEIAQTTTRNARNLFRL